MAKFKQTDGKQSLLVSVNLQQQLIPGTFEWTIDYLIDKIDISLFERDYKNDYSGAAAYPPKAILKTILFCYSRGIISSRKIEVAFRENIVAKALAEDFEPDHSIKCIKRMVWNNCGINQKKRQT